MLRCQPSLYRLGAMERRVWLPVLLPVLLAVIAVAACLGLLGASVLASAIIQVR